MIAGIRRAKKRSTALFLLLFFFLFLCAPAFAVVYSASLEGTVGIAMENFALDVLRKAAQDEASLVVFRLDTPGGLVSSMRGITAAILESPIPVAVWVSPSGARAASAGAFILQAAQVAAMAPGTNVGAAHPVMASGKNAPDTDMKKKITNDLAAQIRSLAQLNGRNADVAERMVTESISITDEEALSLGVADLVASDMESLLMGIRGRDATVGHKNVTLAPPEGPPLEIAMTLRERLLQFITSPDIAYLLLTAGVLAVIFEVMSPGGFVLGTAGSVMILLGAFGLRMLPFNWAGIIFLVAGIAVLVLDLLVGGIGILSLFGLAALVTGGLILFRAPGGELLNVSVRFIAGMSLALGLFFLAALFLVLRSLKKKASSGREGMIGMAVEVVEELVPFGLVKCHGEVWRARTESGRFLEKGRTGKITALHGITLTIEEDGGESQEIVEKNEKKEE